MVMSFRVFRVFRGLLFGTALSRERLRHLALSTEHSYVGWIRRFILLHHKRHPLVSSLVEGGHFLAL